MSDTTERISKLSPEAKRTLLAKLLRAQAQEARSPLSHGQRALWFLYQLAPDSSAYNIASAWRLLGALDTTALRRAFTRLVNRHPALRMTFVIEDGEPAQLIHPQHEVDIVQADAAGWTATDLDTRLNEEARRPFDLERGPVFRVFLFTRSAREHVLLLTFHHIVYDLWSGMTLMADLKALYDAEARNVRCSLEPLPAQYTDYVQWQADLAAGPDGERHWTFWEHELGGELPVLNLPTDRGRPAVQTFPGSSHASTLPTELVHQLRALAKREGATSYVAFLAAYFVLLQRYTAQNDILVGTPTAGRSQATFERVVGYFVNPIVLRADLSEDQPFTAFMGKIRQKVLGALEHADYPFPLLVERLQPIRDPSRSPLFQVAFTWDRLELPTAETGSSVASSRGDGKAASDALEIEFLSGGQQGANFDLELAMFEQEGSITCFWRYNTDLFDAATIERMAEHYEVLLAGIVADPEMHLSELPLLRDRERSEILAAWGSTQSRHEPELCIHEYFEHQVERTPVAPAVVCEKDVLTYEELNERSNQLAHHLRGLGVGPEMVVGICLERSPDMVIGIIGILKSGAAYLPLDPIYPSQRLTFMSEDAGVSVVVTQESLAAKLGGHIQHAVHMDRDRQTIQCESRANPEPMARPDHMAYVIYTSGSTGEPKGVQVTHANVARLFTATEPWFRFDNNDVWTLFHSCAFDFSVWELWGALRYGGRLVVVPYWISRTPEAFYDLLVDEGVTVLNQTPSAFRQLIRVEDDAESEKERPNLSLRLVIFGGEALELQSLRPWFDRHGDEKPQLVNMYGITETTVHVTYRALQAADLAGASGSVIGRPIPDVTVYILDGHLEPVPVGVAGEMYIGGAGLSRGYLRRPELTAERFIADPFSHDPSARLYRSGDLARHLSNGDIEYLGRIDDQIQIRGYRVELGEIEALLEQHPAVEGATVVARDLAPGDTRLWAYLVPSRQHAETVGRLLELEKSGRLPGGSWYELPNGMAVAQLNKNETDFLYQEIFEQETYLRHGVTVAPGDCVFDVGANIGLFSLFVARVCPDVQLYAFEPLPAACEVLRVNAELYGLKAKVFECGVSSELGSDTFVYYPNVSIFSGRLGDGAEVEQVVRSFLHNEGNIRSSDFGASNDALLDELLAERLQHETITCALTTISQVIREQGIERIDLLKIDAEKSEIDVLAGIAEEDWRKIRQLVIEVHAGEGRLNEVKRLLEEHGYGVAVEQDTALSGTGLHNVYAVRETRPSARQLDPGAEGMEETRRDVWTSPSSLVRDVRTMIKQRLPDHMVPSKFVLLDAIPLTANGKVDRRALPDVQQQLERQSHVAPRTELEKQIAGIWRDVLRLDAVGVHDNFFDLGGHSLVATQVISRLRRVSELDIPLRSLFEAPTVEGLASKVVQMQAEQEDEESLARALAEVERL